MPICTLSLADPDVTSRHAKDLANQLEAGDVILLFGSVGAGKTHFARSLIHSLLKAPEDVPSPTFTLVQTYLTSKGEIWHADLYRLSSSDEVEELGLIDAFETAICLIEWPDRLGEQSPADALKITLVAGKGENERMMTAQWQDAKWDQKLAVWQP